MAGNQQNFLFSIVDEGLESNSRVAGKQHKYALGL